MESFLPENYERPTSSGNYLKFVDGANKVRILSAPLIGHLYWTKDNKPVRSPEPFIGTPEDARLDDGKFKPKFFWAMPVWNYRESRVQIMEITQASIQGPIEDLVANSDWGDPREYDITITKKGEGLDTEYGVLPSPTSPVPVQAHQAYRCMKIDLEALFRGADPFAGQIEDAAADVVADNNPYK
jgi:hypothetical protein